MRILHMMIRVVDLEKSIDFYTNVLGMKLVSRQDYPGGKFTNVFLGYGPKESEFVLELTHNWETDSYDKGNGYGHMAIEVEDVYAACEKIREKGGRVTREAGPMKHGTTVLAFVEDPDGYQIELLGA